MAHPGPIGLRPDMWDSLATSVAALFMATAIHALRTRSTGAFVALCATLAVAVTIDRSIPPRRPSAGRGLVVGGRRGQDAPIAQRAHRGVMTMAVLATPVVHLAMYGRVNPRRPWNADLYKR